MSPVLPPEPPRRPWRQTDRQADSPGDGRRSSVNSRSLVSSVHRGASTQHSSKLGTSQTALPHTRQAQHHCATHATTRHLSQAESWHRERAEARESAPHTHVCLIALVRALLHRIPQRSRARAHATTEGVHCLPPYHQARRAHRHACGSFALFRPTLLARASDAVPAAAAHHGVRDEADEHLQGDRVDQWTREPGCANAKVGGGGGYSV